MTKMIPWAALGVVLAGSFSSGLFAEERKKISKDEAAAVVQGVVRQVFRSERQNRTDYIVMVEVSRSEGRLQPAGKRVVF
ncbi:MAG: hypothetical protein ACKO23_14730, partial [Gemmataceae bacterium]